MRNGGIRDQLEETKQAIIRKTSIRTFRAVKVRGWIIGGDITPDAKVSIERDEALEYTLWSVLQQQTESWFKEILERLDREVALEAAYEA